MADKEKTEAKKTNKILTCMLTGIITAVIVTVASYDFWHSSNIRLTFDADSVKELNYQVYYTTDNSTHFNEAHKVVQVVPSGSHSVKIIIPDTKVGRLRLDPGTYPDEVTIKKLKIIGDKVVEFTSFDDYRYAYINSHKINEDGSLTIFSDQSDPYIVTSEELDVIPGDDYNWYLLLLIFAISFILSSRLAIFLINKK